jgi:hypothetical protein
MQIDTKAINYYYSFFEVSKELNQKQFYEFNMAIYKVMFFEVHIDNITFSDAMLTILWKSVKHSVRASVEGYCGKKSIPYDDVFNPLTNPLDNKQEGQEKEKEKEKEKGQVVVVKAFTFTLLKDTHFSKLSDEYISKLKDKIYNFNGALSFEDFEMALLSKSSYKYKDFWLTYQNWNKRENSKQQSKQPTRSFKQQDSQRTDDAVERYLALKEQGFDLRKPNYGMPIEKFEDIEVIENDK